MYRIRAPAVIGLQYGKSLWL